MKKGFILLQSIMLFLHLTMILSFTQQILSNKVTQLERVPEMNQRYYVESEIIKQVMEEFMYYDNKNFIRFIRFCFVYVRYEEEDFTAYITVRGMYNFNAVLEYNDEYAAVKDYYYEGY